MDRSPPLAASAADRPWLLDLRTPGAAGGTSGTPAEAEGAPTGLPPDTLGVALSGGGVRGAAFCLGVLQALARSGWLRHVDYLSTVSGGGYAGSFLGRYFDGARGRPGEPELVPGAVHQRVVRGLGDHDSAPNRWLREQANYLAPGAPGDVAVKVVGFLRNLLTVHMVLGVSLLALFGLLNAVSYGDTLVALATRADDLIGGLAPLVRLLPGDGPRPWLVLSELSLWLAAAPLMIAYWLVSQDAPEAFIAAVLVAAAVIAAALTFMTGGPLPLAVLAAAVLWAIGSWAAVRRAEGPADPRNPYRLAMARDHLTRRLATWLGVTLGLAALGVVDWGGRWLALRLIEGGPTVRQVAAWLASAGTMVLGSATLLRGAALSLAARSPRSATLRRAARRYFWAAALLLGLVPPLVAFSFVSHAAYEVGKAYHQGLAVTAVALVVSLLLGSRECVPFVNRSGPLADHAGRLARTFLGAVNPMRRLHPEGRDVTRTSAGDDVPLSRYRPHLAGGPLHVINCAVNETVDVASHRSARDRRAENVAVGPVGMSVARDWHAFWVDRQPPDRDLDPIDPDGPHPLLGQAGGPVPAESLGLQDWMAISGAAIGLGKGREAGPRNNLLHTLSNARLGYWWDSGLDARDRADSPVKRGRVARLGGLLSSLFRTQRLLLAELTGRFGGPWNRHWYLSDGGAFEVTGAYELLRRRLPFVVVCDAGGDEEHPGSGLATLVRLARIDLGAEVIEVQPDPKTLRALGVPERAIDRLGTLDDLVAPADGLARKHAALLQVRYPEAPPGTSPALDPWLARRLTWVLYLKATCNGDEPTDVRSFAASHPGFPNESTLDQVFDEPQWESYRKLGEHVGEPLFIPGEGRHAPVRPPADPVGACSPDHARDAEPAKLL